MQGIDNEVAIPSPGPEAPLYQTRAKTLAPYMARIAIKKALSSGRGFSPSFT
jgi:hypothetical protein